MQQLLRYGRLPRMMVRLLGLVAEFRVGRSVLPHLGPAVIAYPGPFQVRVCDPGDVAGLSRFRVRLGL